MRTCAKTGLALVDGPVPASPVLLLEGTSYDQDGRPVEVFSTWHHPDHVVFDIGVVKDPGTPPSTGHRGNDGGPGGLFRSTTPAPPGEAPGSAASRARQLGAELLRLADDLSSTNGR
ncbi:UTRA domain-containing protein [Arthrobacter sp. H5]|uniref:UTRA domain-containing protein n=1 Tax=Arthrobacter sp. H5 TaxID=1267973 RepID=UPI000480EE9D|nr:UTRA domain-containing protein [Arthrobacter sp. H5]